MPVLDVDSEAALSVGAGSLVHLSVVSRRFQTATASWSPRNTAVVLQQFLNFVDANEQGRPGDQPPHGHGCLDSRSFA